MKPIEINKGILQICDKINQNLSWTELDYYRLRIIQEQNRLYYYMFNNICPVELQKDIKSMIDQLQGSLDRINTYMSDKKLFSDLTRRLNAIHL